MAHCKECGKYINPVEAMLNYHANCELCGDCVRKKHEEVIHPERR